MKQRADVIVVGAGPVGSCVALGLARAGRSVLVLEKETGPAEHSRAPAIWPRTQEVLANLGVLETLRSRGVLRPELTLHDADRDRRLLSLPLHELQGETPHPELLLLPQSQTERLLHAALGAQPTATLRHGSEVVSLHDEGEEVIVRYRESGATRETTAFFAVGCDGARSVVRETLGFPFDGITYAAQAALADVRLHEDADLPFPRLSTRRGLAIGVRIAADLWRLILPLGAGDEEGLDARVRRAVGDLFGRARYQTIWQSTFRLHRRLASAFARGRIALAGDAAHLNSPVGGQGMNAGIQDAEALVAALEAALARGAPAPLAAYGERRRRAIARGVNRFTDLMTRLVLGGPPRRLPALLTFLRLGLRLRPLRHRVLRRLAMLDAS